jgi:hypothetical protein
LKRGWLTLIAFLAIIALASSRLIAVPSPCKGIDAVYKDFARGDGFVTFDDFISGGVSVDSKQNGLYWTQSVIYPNPKISLAFDQQLATKVILDYSLFFASVTYSTINIPLNELGRKFDYNEMCGGLS